MSKMKVTFKPSYLSGGLIALAGLVLAWLLPGFLPEGMASLAAGAITGGFGVAASGRIWPGLPLKLIYQYGLAVAAYGIVIGLIVGA